MAKIAGISGADDAYITADGLLRILASGRNPDRTRFSLAIQDSNQVPLGNRQLPDLTESRALSEAEGGIPPSARYALLNPTGGNVRYTDGGQDPTSSFGIQLLEGEKFWYTGSDLSLVRVIEESAGAQLNIAYYAPEGG